MKYAKNILEIIGNTPLVRLNKVTAGIKAKILVKLEYLNPGGSIKDRIGLEMIETAEKKGLIKKGGTIIEPTGAGNTGVGLAIVAIIKGYKLIFTMPDKNSPEKINTLRSYGAEVIICPTNVKADDPRSYYKVAERLASAIPNSFYPNQYSNQANPRAHFKTTGPEIWKDTQGKITHFVTGMGTGGTISGIAKYLKKKNPKIKIIGVDADGSIYHHIHTRALKGEDPQELLEEYSFKIHSYKVEGIGEDFIPKNIDLKIIDEVILIKDKEAFLMARKVVKEEGLLIGGSGAASIAAVLKIAKSLPKKAVVVTLIPDSGKSYLSKMYNDQWMIENGFLDDEKSQSQDLVRSNAENDGIERMGISL